MWILTDVIDCKEFASRKGSRAACIWEGLCQLELPEETRLDTRQDSRGWLGRGCNARWAIFEKWAGAMDPKPRKWKELQTDRRTDGPDGPIKRMRSRQRRYGYQKLEIRLFVCRCLRPISSHSFTEGVWESRQTTLNMSDKKLRLCRLWSLHLPHSA